MTSRLGFGWAIFCLALSQCPPALAQPLPPQLTAPVNDFAHVIDAASAAGDRSAHPRAAEGDRRRGRRGDGSALSSRTATSRNTPSRCSRTAGRASGRAARTTACWSSSPSRIGRWESRSATPSRSTSPTASPVRRSAKRSCPSSAAATTAADCSLARHGSSTGSPDARGVNLQDVPREPRRDGSHQSAIPFGDHHLHPVSSS